MNQISMNITNPPGPKRTSPIDIILGRRIADARIAAGLSQGEIGEALGVTFQQIQKYEIGQNRISAASLIRIALHLHLPPAAFLDGFEPEGERPLPPPPITRDQRALLDDFRVLTSPEIKEGLRRLIRTLAAEERAKRENTL